VQSFTAHMPLLTAHLYTTTRLTALCPGLPGTRKVKPIWILLKQETMSGSGISWAICKSAPRSRQITTPTPHHSSNYVQQLLLLLLLHPFNGIFSRTAWVSQYQKRRTSLDLNEARDDRVWDAVALAGPYTNNLHLAPDRQPHQHLISQFLQAGCSS